MATPSTADPLAAKARKQKKILAVGGVLLVVVLFVQVPRTLKMLKGDEAASAAPPVAAATAGAPTEAAAESESQPVEETAAADAPDALVSFGRFETKDPFIQQVSSAEAPARARETEGTGAAKAGKPAKGAAGQGQAGGPIFEGVPEGQVEGAAASAKIAVNGQVETVSVEGQFPAAAPMFALESIQKRTVTIRVSQGGSFASGDPTLTLELGKRVTLVNTADGTRFVLLLKKAFP